MNDIQTVAGAPVACPRKFAPSMRFAAYITSLGTQVTWIILGMAPALGSVILLYSSDRHGVVGSAITMFIIMAVVTFPLALWAFLRGGRKSYREFKLLRSGPVAAGKVTDISSKVMKYRGKNILEWVYEIEYQSFAGKMRIFKQVVLDDGSGDPNIRLQRLGINPEEIAVFYDREDANHATTPISLNCKFDDSGTVIPASKLVLIFSHIPPILSILSFLAFIGLLISSST